MNPHGLQSSLACQGPNRILLASLLTLGASDPVGALFNSLALKVGTLDPATHVFRNLNEAEVDAVLREGVRQLHSSHAAANDHHFFRCAKWRILHRIEV